MRAKNRVLSALFFNTCCVITASSIAGCSPITMSASKFRQVVSSSDNGSNTARGESGSGNSVKIGEPSEVFKLILKTYREGQDLPSFVLPAAAYTSKIASLPQQEIVTISQDSSPEELDSLREHSAIVFRMAPGAVNPCPSFAYVGLDLSAKAIEDAGFATALMTRCQKLSDRDALFTISPSRQSRASWSKMASHIQSISVRMRSNAGIQLQLADDRDGQDHHREN